MTASAASIVGCSGADADGDERPENDFYPTPPECTFKLLDIEGFQGTTWEPACGDGTGVVEPMRARGHKVLYSDIDDHGFPGARRLDFLGPWKSNFKVNNVITNPPFRLAQPFVEKSLSLTTDKVAMFLKLQFLEGVKREPFFRSSPLARVYVFSARQKLGRRGKKYKNGGLICFAWFVWDHSYKGKPTIDWIL